MTEVPRPRGFQSPMTIRKRAAAAARKPMFHWLASDAAENLFVVVAISAIGLLATINVVLRFPDLGLLIESYNTF